MIKSFLLVIVGCAIPIVVDYMRLTGLNFVSRNFSSISTLMAANKEVKVEPYSMAFVTAPNKDVAKTLAGGLGKFYKFVKLKYNFRVKITNFYTELGERKVDFLS